MKVILYILMAWIMMGCGRHSVDSRLAQVNELANRNETDSAMMVLSSIEKPSLNEHNRHYYDLMSIKTRDKAYQDITGDTVITDIIDYFDGNGSDYEKGEAYYYGGRVYREMGDAPQALDCFQKAQDVFPEDEAMMKGKTASQMGQIFLNMYMFEHAKPKFQEAIRYQTLSKDTLGLIFDLRDLGKTYHSLGKHDDVMHCYNKALEITDIFEPRGITEIEIRDYICDYYISEGYFEEAIKEYHTIESLFQGDTLPDYLLMTGINIYIIKKDYPKLEKYAQQLLTSKSIYCKKYAYETLADLSKYKGEKEEAFVYVMKFKECFDSIDDSASRNAIIHQNSFYNYTLREKENIKLRDKQFTIIALSVCSIFILMFLVFVFVRVNRKTKRKNLALNEQNKTLQDTCDNLEIENQRLLSEQDQMKIYLTQQLNKISLLETDNKLFRRSLLETEITDEINQQILLKIKNINTDNYQPNREILDSDIYVLFKRASNDENVKITENNWSELDMLVNKIHTDFKNKLTYLSENISMADYRMCLLIKCKFPIKEISKITSKVPNAVTNQRKRLYKKLFGVEGTPMTLIAI